MQQQCLALYEAAELACEPGWPLLVLSHFIALLCGALLSRFWRPIKVEMSSQTVSDQMSDKMSDKSVQAPVTYTALRGVVSPRYLPLGNHAWGAWP